MRYAKGSLVINAERDVPLLRQVRNSKFVSHHQLFEFMKLGGFDHSRNSFNWRVKRLLDSGHIGVCQRVYGAGSTVYRVTKDGITLLEHHGQFTAVLHSTTDHQAVTQAKREAQSKIVKLLRSTTPELATSLTGSEGLRP